MNKLVDVAEKWACSYGNRRGSHRGPSRGGGVLNGILRGRKVRLSRAHFKSCICSDVTVCRCAFYTDLVSRGISIVSSSASATAAVTAASKASAVSRGSACKWPLSSSTAVAYTAQSASSQFPKHAAPPKHRPLQHPNLLHALLPPTNNTVQRQPPTVQVLSPMFPLLKAGGNRFVCQFLWSGCWGRRVH